MTIVRAEEDLRFGAISGSVLDHQVLTGYAVLVVSGKEVDVTLSGGFAIVESDVRALCGGGDVTLVNSGGAHLLNIGRSEHEERSLFNLVAFSIKSEAKLINAGNVVCALCVTNATDSGVAGELAVSDGLFSYEAMVSSCTESLTFITVSAVLSAVDIILYGMSTIVDISLNLDESARGVEGYCIAFAVNCLSYYGNDHVFARLVSSYIASNLSELNVVEFVLCVDNDIDSC